MSQSVPTLAYQSPSTENCPLCDSRPVWHKPLYGHGVCKKCYYRFANRRQLAYLIDSVLFALTIGAVLVVLELQLTISDELTSLVVDALIALAAGVLFILKDGFSGQSPGRRLTGVQVVDDSSGIPISFGQSFKRNAILLAGQIPVLGRLAGLVVIVMIIIKMNKGYRPGDRFANTRVIWKKHARSHVFGGDGLMCESCGYELTGNLSGVCPECGRALSERTRAILGMPPATPVPSTRP